MLTGTCNRCGACCRVESAGRVYACEHLNANGCQVYEQRVDGMPVRMVSGMEVRPAVCRVGEAEEPLILRVINQCSLEVAR